MKEVLKFPLGGRSVATYLVSYSLTQHTQEKKARVHGTLKTKEFPCKVRALVRH